MKNTVKILFWVTLIVSVTFSYAGVSDSQLEVNMIGDKTFSLTLNSEIDGNVQVLLRNRKGNVVTEQAFKDGVTTVEFDLNKVKEGSYHLELIDAKEMVLMPVEVAENKVKIKEDEKEIYSFPVIFQKGEMVTVSKWAPKRERISVLILDPDRELVHVETLVGDKTLTKRFDFSYVDAGKYEIQVSCKNQTLKKSVAVK